MNKAQEASTLLEAAATAFSLGDREYAVGLFWDACFAIDEVHDPQDYLALYLRSERIAAKYIVPNIYKETE